MSRKQVTTSRAHFYLTEVETQFNIFTSLLHLPPPSWSWLSEKIDAVALVLCVDYWGWVGTPPFQILYSGVFENRILSWDNSCDYPLSTAPAQQLRGGWLWQAASHREQCSKSILFRFEGFLVGLSFANLLLVKSLEMSCIYHANVVSYALTKLPSMFPNVEALTIHSFDEVQSETFDDYDHWYAYNCTWNIITLRHLLCRLTTHQWCQTNSSISSTCLFCRVGLFPGLWLPFSGFFLWRFSLIGDLHIICKLMFMLQIYMPGFLVQPLTRVC